jgi:hypothetical protein
MSDEGPHQQPDVLEDSLGDTKRPEYMTDVTFFGFQQYKLALLRIEHYWKENGKEELSEVVYKDAKALVDINFKGVQDFKERLRDAFRAAGKRGAEAYAKAVYEEMTQGAQKFGVSAYLTTTSLPNDPDLKAGEYGKFCFIARNGDKLEIPF